MTRGLPQDPSLAYIEVERSGDALPLPFRACLLAEWRRAKYGDPSAERRRWVYAANVVINLHNATKSSESKTTAQWGFGATRRPYRTARIRRARGCPAHDGR